MSSGHRSMKAIMPIAAGTTYVTAISGLPSQSTITASQLRTSVASIAFAVQIRVLLIRVPCQDAVVEGVPHTVAVRVLAVVVVDHRDRIQPGSDGQELFLAEE